MATLYLSSRNADNRVISLKSLTNRQAAVANPPIATPSGYYLVEEEAAELSVLARVETEEAALRLGALLGLA